MDRRFLIKDLLAVAFGTLMVLTSELLRTPAILFPEILALLTGMWVTPRMPWRVRRWEIPPLMTVCAVWGAALSRWSPLGTAWTICIAFAGAALLLLAVRSTLLPVLSACILPILLGEHSWVYPVAVAVMTVLLCLGQTLLERFQLRKPQTPETWHWNGREEALRWPVAIGTVTALAAVGVSLGVPCVAAPPLAVLLSELSFRESPAAPFSMQIWAGTVCCAAAGALARWVLCVRLGLPLTVAALAASAMAMAIFALLRRPFPPSAALALLPLLLPETLISTYPAQVAVGGLICLLAAGCIRHATAEMPVLLKAGVVGSNMNRKR